VKGFAAGFITASAIAIAIWAVWLRVPPPAAEPELARAPADPAPTTAAAKKGGRVRRTPGEPSAPGETFDDRGISDDLTPEALHLDAESEGGERPISNDAVESTIGASWSRINRCILVDAADRETPVHGTVRLGIRIRPNGSVAAVTATAPPELQGGSVVACLRTTVATLRFPPFEGREAVVSYPIRIE
jgi:hypothetical protein